MGKKKNVLPEVICYTDELNDEFSEAKIDAITIDENYNYGGNGLGFKLLRLFYYRLFALPVAFVYLKMHWGHRIVGREKIKPYQKNSFFLFANHTNPIADALIPTFVSYPKHAFVIVHAANVSIPGLGQSTKYLGAIPLPGNMKATKNFLDTVKLRVEEKKSVTIYPEAHIWPYYTKIRPFTDLSFRYPVQYKTPVFAFTNTYQKRKGTDVPRIVTYVDGPFFADETLSVKEQRAKLRNEVYEAMCERSKNNNVEVIRYEKRIDMLDGETK